MKAHSIPVLACLALAFVACSPAQNPTSPTASLLVSNTAVVSTPSVTSVPPTATPSGPVGSISGQIVPIGTAQPATALKLFAREKDAGTIIETDIPIDATSYTIPNIPLGIYNVFAWYYPGGLPGAYTSLKITNAETSEDQFNCTDALVDVTISMNSLDFKGADMACWGGNYFSYLPTSLLPK